MKKAEVARLTQQPELVLATLGLPHRLLAFVAGALRLYI